ncbi:MAG TPA: site-2 protease family protein [bacterium]|nr:site-2 protease family protein [bacterium]HPP00951.1 site-2 protease family protein [bacterium]
MLQIILNNPQVGIAMFAMLILAISVHEMAHAWMAYRCGDDTAARLGRMTLNPVVHFDPMGFLFILMAPIGWGKPVPFNPLNLRDVQRDSMLIALAGPVSNLIQAVALAGVFRLFLYEPVADLILRLPSGESIFQAGILVSSYGVLINLALAFFNLIPLFPLDGEKILAGILPREQAYKLEEFRQYSVMIFFTLIGISFVFNVPIFGYYLQVVVDPIRKLLIGM